MIATLGGVASNSRPELATCHGLGGPCHNEYQKNFLLPKRDIRIYIRLNIPVTKTLERETPRKPCGVPVPYENRTKQRP
jgi:hypothetical protein